MATKSDDVIQEEKEEDGTISVAVSKTEVMDDEGPTKGRPKSDTYTDCDTLPAASLPRPTIGNQSRNNTIPLDSIARVEAGKNAKEKAAGHLLKSFEKSKFIIAVNNMTDHDLVRSASSGSDSWPFCSIRKKECVAALFDHSQFENLNVLFTADDDQPGIRTAMLCAHWMEDGRGIRIYAGKTQPNSEKSIEKKSMTMNRTETKQ